jgi:hypothetical protein
MDHRGGEAKNRSPVSIFRWRMILQCLGRGEEVRPRIGRRFRFSENDFTRFLIAGDREYRNGVGHFEQVL